MKAHGRFLWAFLLFAVGLGAAAIEGCRSDQPITVRDPDDFGPQFAQPPSDPPPSVTKTVQLAVLEDYDKGADLNDIALDFQLMNELGIDVMRCSFGWDDYEPSQGQYDFLWLNDFVVRAAQNGVKLRPYIAYTAPWAAINGPGGGSDGIYWNDPPANYQDWYNFCFNLAGSLSSHSNLLSYEIYNEENDSFWWDGTLEQYKETLLQAANAIRTADPGTEIVLGGFVFPEYEWIDGITSTGHAQYYEITPFHAYPETWSGNNVVVENYLDVQYHDFFVPTNNSQGEAEPIWINESGYSTLDRTEEQQANWWARAVFTFFADPEIEQIGVYEIKDLDPSSPAIGDEHNYHLGITTHDRTKKKAFYTVQMLAGFFHNQTVTTADAEITVTATQGREGKLYKHLLKRSDGEQFLIVYDKRKSPTVQVTVETPGSAAYKYNIFDNTFTQYNDFTGGTTLNNVALTVNEVAVFRIAP